ncbi:MAG: hypothetical protein J6X27_00685 [Bacteroidaceae bacterium]|nr:hypothetical protein [Bacteroidaceae bacterium]
MARLGYYPYVIEDEATGTLKYSVRLKAYSTIDEDEVMNKGAVMANCSSGELARGFAALSQVIDELVLNGHSITIKNLGCFTLSTRTGIWDERTQKWTSAGKESMDDVSPNDIRGLYLRFYPCTAIRNELKNATFFNVVDEKYGVSSGLDPKDGVTDGYGTQPATPTPNP